MVTLGVKALMNLLGGHNTIHNTHILTLINLSKSDLRINDAD